MVDFSVSQPASQAKYPRIYLDIRRRIVEGQLKSGDQLPTRDVLEQQFGVSRGTVLEAIRRLKRDGFLITRRRGGTRVANTLPHLCDYGIAFQQDPRQPERWSRFEQLIQQEAERAMADRAGRLLVYYGLESENDRESLHRLASDIEAHRMAGLVLVHMGKWLRDTVVCQAPHIQRVLISYAANMPEAPSIYPDGSQFAQLALRYAQQRGRKRLAVLSLTETASTDTEEGNWQPLVEPYGMTCPRRWQQGAPLHPQNWARRLAELLVSGPDADRPDALLVTDDHLIESATQGVADAGIRVPDELDVISWCNFPAPTQTAVPVTWVGAHASELIEQCLSLLHAQQRGDQVPTMTHLQVQLQESN